MSDLQPEGENVRRAVRWISEELARDPDQKLVTLLDHAMRRFDLSPIQSERLVVFYRTRRTGDANG